jgi:hypothetical protein
MSGKFKVTSSDGSEFFVSEMGTLQNLYRSGRIGADTPIQMPGSEHSRPLGQAFNLVEWNTVPDANVFSRARAATVHTSVQPNADRWAHLRYDDVGVASYREKPINHGIRAAGILLIVNAIVIGLEFFFLKLSGNQGFAQLAPVILSIDLIVGGILASGKWKPLGILRALLGGLIFGLVIPLYLQTPLALIEGGLQLVVAIGLLVILYGDRATIARTVVGLLLTCSALVGVHRIAAVKDLLPEWRLIATEKKLQQDVEPYTLSTRTYSDPESGISATMPTGWTMLKPDNPFTQVPTAKMIIVNPQAVCFAGLVAQTIPPNTNINSINDYQNALLQNPTSEGKLMTKLSTTPSQFGSLVQTEVSQRIELSWAHSGMQFHGWRSVCRVGNTYYTLTEWGPEEEKDLGFDAFVKLESVFQITGPKPSHK